MFGGVRVERKGAESLNRVEKQQGSAGVDSFGQSRRINPPAAGIADPTDRHDASALVAGFEQPIEIDPAAVGGHAAAFRRRGWPD